MPVFGVPDRPKLTRVHPDLDERSALVTSTNDRTIEPLAVSVNDAIRISGLGRTSLYEAVGSGTLASLKIGKRRLILLDSLKAWLLSHEASR